MGIFDILKPKRKTEESKELNPQLVLKRAAETYRLIMEERDELLAELDRAGAGLSERDTMLLDAARDGLISAPSHIASRLEILGRLMVHLERRLTEAELSQDAGLRGKDEAWAALELLRLQPWWPKFMARVRAEMGIRTADDIGCWLNATKKEAPYIYEAGRMYQTPDDYRNNGPITQWTFRVDLAAGTVDPFESVDAQKYDECVNRLADKVIGLSFALWAERDRSGGILQGLQDRDSIDWSTVAFEYMMCYQHLIDRYAFGLYGSQFRAEVMDSLYDPLVRKFAETGAVRADRLEEFRSIFTDTLNERNAEYANYNTDAPNQENADEVLKGTLFWEFGKRIATIIGATNVMWVSACVRKMYIAGLLVLEPIKELKELKELIDAGKMV